MSSPVGEGFDMKLSMSLGSYPAARPLNADQILEYHAARILLLLHLCGQKGKIKGLTKLAKLDFFVRYPSFFNQAATELNSHENKSYAMNDTAMIRHHYGPWDPRYYQVLAYLESRELITVDKEKKAFIFSLTDIGVEMAMHLASHASFNELVEHMRKVKSVFGSKSGDSLKKLVYSVFDEEVAKLSKGEIIR